MSRADVAREYLHERYPARRFVLLAVLLATAGIVSNPGSLTVASALRAAVTSWLIVLPLRIWDDIEDRDRDRRRHPDRMTLRADAPAGMFILAAASSIGAIALLTVGPEPRTRLIALVILVVALGVWYQVRRMLVPSTPATAFGVLLKYPVIAWLVSPGTADGIELASAAPTLIGLYLLLCIHEVVDDAELRRS